MHAKKILYSLAIVIVVGAVWSTHQVSAAIVSFADGRVVYVADKSAVLGVMINEPEANWEDIQVELGVESGTYTTTVYGGSFDDSVAGGETYYLISETEDILLPKTTYYARFLVQDNTTIKSDEVIFTTKASEDLKIDSITPTEGLVGTEVKIKGVGFGTLLTGGVVYFGNCSIERNSSSCGEIVSWNDTEIVAKVTGDIPGGNVSASGAVGIRKELRTSGSAIAYRLVKALEGSVFTITNRATPTNTNAASVNANVGSSNLNVSDVNNNPDVGASAQSDSPLTSLIVYAIAALVVAGVLIYMAIRLRQAGKK